MAECRPCATQMEERLKLSKHNTAAKVDATRYGASAAGCATSLIPGRTLRSRLGTSSVSWTHVKTTGRRSRGCCAPSRGRLIKQSSSPSMAAKVG